jgi:spore maturation protein CgeB
MRIITLRSRGVIAPHVMDGFSRALEASGHPHLTLDITSGFKESSLAEIERFKPDFILAYDFNGYIQNPNGYLIREMGLPLIALHYDNPFYIINDKLDAELRSHPGYYYNFIWDSSYLNLYQMRGYKNGFSLLLATDPALFHPQNIENTNSYAFVGDINLKTELEKRQAPILQNFIHTVIELKIEHFSIPLSRICLETMENSIFSEVKQACIRNEETFWRLHYVAHETGTPCYRCSILKHINCDELHLYGTDGHSQSNSVCHEKVAYGSDLSQIYQRHAINLNLSSLQLETSVNNRVFDAFASNAFVLSDYKRDMESLFPEYWREITFSSLEELADKGRYYKTHESERKALTWELHQQVRSNHTYIQRLQYILQTVADASHRLA